MNNCMMNILLKFQFPPLNGLEEIAISNVFNIPAPPKLICTAATQFLALLDYVSRAHEIKIRPSYVVRRTSYVRGIDYL